MRQDARPPQRLEFLYFKSVPFWFPSVAGLEDAAARQPPLFPDPAEQRQTAFDTALDRLNRHFGQGQVRRGDLLEGEEREG